MEKQRNIMKIKSPISFLVSLVMVISLFIPLASYAKEQEKKVVRVGWYDSKLFCTKDSQGRRVGYAYDYQQRIANYTGWTYEYVEGDWAELLKMLEDGEIDLLSDVAYSDERASNICYSSMEMCVENYYLFVSSNNTEIAENDYSILNNKKIGVIADHIEAEFWKSWSEQHGVTADVAIVSGSLEDMQSMLRNKEIDAYVYSDEELCREDVVSLCQIGDTSQYFAVSKDREDLMAELDAAMNHIQSENRYYHQQLMSKYLGNHGASRSLSVNELKWLKEHGVIRVGYRDNYLPICGTDEATGEASGMLKDYLCEAETLFGNADLSFQLIPYPSTQDAKDALKQGEIDCVFPVNMALSDAEEERLIISDPVAESQMDMIVSKANYSNIDLNGNIRIAVNEGNTGYNKILSNYFPNCEIVSFETIGECLKGIARGEADGIIANPYLTANMQKYLDQLKLISMNTNAMSEMDFLLKAGDKDLYSILSKIRNRIPDASVQNMILANTTIDTSVSFIDFIKENLLQVLILCAVIAAVLVFLLVRSRKAEKAARLAEKHTAEANTEIQEVNAQLEEHQAQLEESTAEQEAQIEEISLLNNRLSQQNDIVASAGLGIWYIYLKNDEAPRMQPDEKMRELLGIKGMNLSEEEIYSYWFDRILPDAVESVNNSVSKIVSGFFDENTYQWNHPVKGVIYVRCGGNAKTQPDGTIVLSGYHADVTDIVSKEKQQQKNLEEAVLEAEKAMKAKSLFLSRMSHDIRTPLNGIIGLIELAERHPDDIKVWLDGKEKAKLASQHLLSLVNDVLELSKLDDENVTLAHEPFNILELAGDVLAIAGSSAAEYGVTMLHENCSQEFKYPYVFGSPLHVRQILLNIISNAAKYNRPGGSIHCRARMDTKTDTTVTYTVEVEDTGIGMSPEFLEHIFEPFTQERSDARSTFQGTGLGMAIVKHLVDKMNGTISVQSKLGEGSKFTVSIPFEIAGETDMPKKAYVNDKDITGMKLLLVEDNELNMEIARSILEDFGSIITEAENGQQAVDIFTENAPGTFDAILMDVMMPVLDGYSATRKIREMKREDAKKIPIIAMTANAFEEDRQNALKAGMNGHIAKPIEVPKLLETLSGILEEENNQ